MSKVTDVAWMNGVEVAVGSTHPCHEAASSNRIDCEGISEEDHHEPRGATSRITMLALLIFKRVRRIYGDGNICSNLVRGRDGCFIRGAGGTDPVFGNS